MVTHNFELLKNTVPGDSIESFLMQIDKVKDEMHYYLTYNNNNLTKFKISWISILIALISTILSVLLMIFIYKKYDPQPDYRHTNKPFGGWLILPIIGLLTTPLVLCIQIFTQHFFNQNTWVNIYQSPETLPTASAFLIAGEIIYNFFILTFSIFLIILLFKKRSSFPNLISVYYTVALLGAIVDLVFSKIIMPDLITASLNNDSVQTIVRLLFVAFIWIPYFQFSERVKTTFCKTIS